MVTVDEIKAFAHSQLGKENPAVSVSDGEFDIADPWYSTTSSGEYFTNDEAVDYWGAELVAEFIAKATVYLENMGN